MQMTEEQRAAVVELMVNAIVDAMIAVGIPSKEIDERAAISVAACTRVALAAASAAVGMGDEAIALVTNSARTLGGAAA